MTERQRADLVPAAHHPMALVDALACALDADNYDAARPLLDVGCVYIAGATTRTGPDAVLASFSETSAWGRSVFDRVVFTHVCEPCDDCTARIRFVDDLECRGLSHRHICLMHVTVVDGRVARLRLEKIDTEATSLAAFLEELGVQG